MLDMMLITLKAFLKDKSVRKETLDNAEQTMERWKQTNNIPLTKEDVVVLTGAKSEKGKI